MWQRCPRDESPVRRRLFTFSAERVPSIRLPTGREPVCADCVARVNPRRIENGLPPIEILPGAYEPDEV